MSKAYAMSDALLDLLFRTTEDYAIILLDAEGSVRAWNPGAERVLGWTAAEAIGIPADRIFVPSDRQAGVPAVELSTAREYGRAEDERWHIRKDGSRFWASGVLVGLREDGKLRGYAKVLRDFTEQRQLDSDVRETQKLESIGILAAGIAHDFNNVLTVILGNVSLALSTPTAAPISQIRQGLEEAERAAHRAARLVQQLLDYAGKGRRVVRPVDVARIVADTIGIVRASISPRIRIALDVPSPISIHADPGQINQLVLSLILNAAEAIGDNPGAVHVELRVRAFDEPELRERYNGFPLPPRPYTELVVRDTGTGIDQETLKQIFDPFFSTKFLGRGLGLAAALGIVRSHGGGIAVESAPGKGSAFRVILPAEDVAAPPKTVADAVAEAGQGNGLVLVVDDEVAIRALVSRMLEELGYTVLVAEHGEQGVELLERTGEGIGLALLDLSMPGMDGAATATALQERRPDLPIIIMTALADEAALQRLRRVRVAGFVAKPFAREQLAQVIAVAIR